MTVSDLPDDLVAALRQGLVIPAHPLALDAQRRFDERSQKALTRYYVDAGAGGLAVGVHSTQFEIREPNIGLFKPVLELASAEIDSYSASRGRALIKIAGLCGRTEQAVAEAEFAVATGYHAGLLSVAALANESVETMVEHCRQVAQAIPIIGFYLQPAVGGRVLPYAFWRQFAEIENVLAIKMAPFNRYQTLDVVRALVDAGRDDVALYTGNDDNIIVDLLTAYRLQSPNGPRTVRIVGGLLGHWACWTAKAVEQLALVHQTLAGGNVVPGELLTLNVEVTDTNAAFFDAANRFDGCLPGINEVLRRQGLVQARCCLDERLELSPGQAAELDRVHAAYPHLNDDAFVAENLDRWRS